MVRRVKENPNWAMEWRWRFLVPWCKVLDGKLHSCGRRTWDNSRLDLELVLPAREGESAGCEGEFQASLQKMREALVLLAAVAHVDHAVWRYLLARHCNVELEVDMEAPGQFQIAVTDVAGSYGQDLVEFCGVRYPDRASDAFVNAWAKISGIYAREHPDAPALDIVIPLHVHFPRTNSKVTKLEEITQADQVIKKQWAQYNRDNATESAKRFRYTFALNPILADLRGCRPDAEVSQAINRLISSNMRFSALLVNVSMKPEAIAVDERAAKLVFGELVTSLFALTRRSSEFVKASHYPLPHPELQSRQLERVAINCAHGMRRTEFESMCSAMAMNQATSSLAICLPSDPASSSPYYWKWLAYALFSKRSPLSLEALEISNVGTLSIAAKEGILAVMQSEHPEEYLFGLPRGLEMEKTCTLASGSPIRWEFDEDGEPILTSEALQLQSDVFSVRTFSDDGTSEWVNVLVPGFGRCQARRGDVIFGGENMTRPCKRELTSLTINSDSLGGLPMLLEAVGDSLTHLTLWAPEMDIDASVILQCCPRLRQLTWKGRYLAMQLDVSKLQGASEPVSLGRWHDPIEVARALGDQYHALGQSVTRMSVFLAAVWVRNGVSDIPNIEHCIIALRRMLKANGSLAYFKLVVNSWHRKCLGGFERYHGQPLCKPLRPALMGSKLTFLSVSRSKLKTANRHASGVANLDPYVVANIFEFAAVPVRRQVFVRIE